MVNVTSKLALNLFLSLTSFFLALFEYSFAKQGEENSKD